MRILLVDDDPIFRELAAAKLAAQNLTQITFACSAEEALEIVEAQRIPFDCYLLDIMLGEMDGIELCRRLRDRVDARLAPIIMITSNQATHLMDRAFAAGATDFLRKPLDEIEIAGRIKMAMLLVQTAKQEKRGRSALRALISYGSDFNLIDLGERVCFPDVDGMLDYYQLENQLLTMQRGQYHLAVFRIRIKNFNKRNRRTDRAKLLKELHAVSTRISEEVPARHMLLSYIGHGHFVCCIVGRGANVSGIFANSQQASACDALQGLATDANSEPPLEVTALSRQNVLQRDVALSLVREEFKAVGDASPTGLPEVNLIEDRIFAKIEEFEGASFDSD